MTFQCNICGTLNTVEKFATEPPSCVCGSNVRLRALMHLLSLELFGVSLVVSDFPIIKAIRGLGMSDNDCYAEILAEKFDYTNTFYDREPRFDFTEEHRTLAGSYDFILSADVLEHITPPVENALLECHRLLKPTGLLAITVYCNPADRMREHFPNLNEYRIVPLGTTSVLVNRLPDGTFEVRDDLVFHDGTGVTLEMREFGISELKHKLLAAGFSKVEFFNDDLLLNGILFDFDVSQPLIARKEPFTMDACARSQLVRDWRTQQERLRVQTASCDHLTKDLAAATDANDLLKYQIAMVRQSRWVRLGRAFGLGPRL